MAATRPVGVAVLLTLPLPDRAHPPPPNPPSTSPRSAKNRLVALCIFSSAKTGLFAVWLHSGPLLQIVRRAHTFGKKHLAKTSWAYAKSGRSAPEVFEAVGKQITACDRARRLGPRELSTLAWAFAKANQRDEKVRPC